MTVLKALFMLVSVAVASPSYPPINVIEKVLNVYPGAQLPKEIVYNGQIFYPFYVKAVSKGNGEYIAIIRLKPMR